MRTLTLCVTLGVATGVAACGGQSRESSSNREAAGTGGSAGSGDSSSGGSSSGGWAAGQAPDPCFGADYQLVPQAKACEVDLDCMPVATASCCGASVVVGIAKTESAYEACYFFSVQCPPLGCFSQAESEAGRPLDNGNQVTVACVSLDGGPKACRTFSGDPAQTGSTWVCTCSNAASCCKMSAGG
ncbi:MAG TPA: hypothetical protein VGM29_03950 [Polyangiaceae bacterium]